MFGVGSAEMIVIAIVAMLLFPPRELPKMLRMVARFWNQLRSTADEFKESIMHADGMDELSDMVRGTQQQIRGIEDEARREMVKAREQLRRAQQKLALTNKAKQAQREANANAALKSEDAARGAPSDASIADEAAEPDRATAARTGVASEGSPGADVAPGVDQGAA